MTISYDPGDKPDYHDPDMDEAEAIGLIPLHVMCRSTSDAAFHVAFIAYINHVPRIGEQIVLQDGKHCEVRMIYHKVIGFGEKSHALVPNVMAYLLEQE